MEVYKGKLTGDYKSDLAGIETILRPDANFDIIRKTMKFICGQQICLTAVCLWK